MIRPQLKIATVLIAVFVSTVISCGQFPAGGLDTPSGASLDIEVVASANASGVTCTSSLEWELRPVNITGSVGRRDIIRGNRDRVETTSVVIRPDPELPTYGCIFRVGEIGLALGTWDITVSAPPGGATQCRRQLGAGRNVARFTFGTSGCT
jgi:hypothetical protein